MLEQTLRFKTTINCASCVATVTPVLDNLVGNGKWNVDTTVREKILTVEREMSAMQVINALQQIGYKAEEL